MALAIALCEMVSTCSSSFLFFLRVWSLYSNEAFIRYPFLVFLITVIGVSSVVPIGKHAVPLPETRYCLEMRLETYVGATTLLYLLFELSVYLSIAYKIATMPGISGEATSIRSLATPKMRRRLLRAFFHQGQQHYLASIAFNIAVSVAIIVPSISSDYKNMLLIPDLALSSAMACRVFRHLTLSTDRLEDVLAKSGIIAFQNRRQTRDHTTESNISTLRPMDSESDFPFPERPRLRSISLRSMHVPLGPVSEEPRPSLPKMTIAQTSEPSQSQ
ncbi:hypothetical protein BJ165DRAFT_354353 [Panaeolus papilionaceus]|nr:hypothetical protein BJ165DRAFT_354353 [Panaeolus papilionaceus]